MTINTNYKAVETVLPANDPNQAGNDLGYLAELKLRLDEALRELEQYRNENGVYLNDEQLMKLDWIAVTLEAEAAAVATFGVEPVSPTTPEQTDAQVNWINDLPSGWSVAEGSTLRITDDPEYAGTILEDPSLCAGIINFEADEIAINLDDPDITKIEVRTAGKDLVFTVFKGDEKQEYIMIDGSVRSEVIFIYTDGADVDCSKAYRFADGRHGQPYGLISGFNIYGGDKAEYIIGSQGVDGIDAGGGDDIIYGQAGDDIISGGDGDDFIDGGVGGDTIDGGPGIDSGVLTDSIHNNEPDDISNMSGAMTNNASEIPDPLTTGWLELEGWEYEIDNGEIVVSRNDDIGGNLDLYLDRIPGNYTMAFAEQSPDEMSMIVTLVGEDGNTIRIRFENILGETPYYNPRQATTIFTVHGSDKDEIMDFHKLGEVKIKNFILNLNGGDGNDMLFGIENQLLVDNVDPSTWQSSTANGASINSYESGGIFTNEEDGYQSEVRGNQIIVTARSSEPLPDTDDPQCRIVAPEDYTSGYITYDTDGRVCVILVNGEDTMVIKFDDASLNHNNIHVFPDMPGVPMEGEDFSAAGPALELIPINFYDESGRLLDMYQTYGGGGSDILFGPEGFNHDNDPDDYVIEGSNDGVSGGYTPPIPPTPPAPDPEPEDPEDPVDPEE